MVSVLRFGGVIIRLDDGQERLVNANFLIKVSDFKEEWRYLGMNKPPISKAQQRYWELIQRRVPRMMERTRGAVRPRGVTPVGEAFVPERPIDTVEGALKLSHYEQKRKKREKKRAREEAHFAQLETIFEETKEGLEEVVRD